MTTKKFVEVDIYYQPRNSVPDAALDNKIQEAVGQFVAWAGQGFTMGEPAIRDIEFRGLITAEKAAAVRALVADIRQWKRITRAVVRISDKRPVRSAIKTWERKDDRHQPSTGIESQRSGTSRQVSRPRAIRAE